MGHNQAVTASGARTALCPRSSRGAAGQLLRRAARSWKTKPSRVGGLGRNRGPGRLLAWAPPDAMPLVLRFSYHLHGRARGIVARQSPPLAAGHQDIEDGVHTRAAGMKGTIKRHSSSVVSLA